MLFMSIVGLGLTGVKLASGAAADQEAYEIGLKNQKKAIYKKVYDREVTNANLRKAKHAAELNVAAVHQDKVLSDSEIKLRQDKAQALIEVSAATSGVSGSSVSSTVYSSERNEAFALSNNERKYEQTSEGLLADIGNKQAAMLEIEDVEIDYSGAPSVFDSLNRLTAADLDNMATIGEELWG